MRRLGLATHSGEHTYRAAITPETAPHILQAVPAIFGQIEQLVQERASG